MKPKEKAIKYLAKHYDFKGNYLNDLCYTLEKKILDIALEEQAKQIFNDIEETVPFGLLIVQGYQMLKFESIKRKWLK